MPNRLASSTSPYLLQHKDNPVDWFEWGDEASAEALRRGVPIFLSVGYSACHWCHVMAHESFEDQATAAVLNERFVNVKVDREERPDVDAIYMSAVQSMTGQGGWPMSVWLTPDGMPFFAGTYFPPTPRHGMASFLQVVDAITDAWETQRDQITDQAARITAAIGRVTPHSPSRPEEKELAAAYETVSRSFDRAHGGFGGAPKFPQAPVLNFLLSAEGHDWAPDALEMLTTTLNHMAAGGLRDHVGGGFARYSVDARWEIPHFEKMLYDNAQLALLYLRTWSAHENPAYREIAVETIEYVLRDLALPDGGFASAEDADSEGEEGKFYVWSLAEFEQIAGPDGAVTADLWGVAERGNFEGANHLRVVDSIDAIAERHNTTPEAVAAAARRVLDRLLVERSGRVRPGLDDKVVTAWNGLMLRVLAEAGAALDEPRYVDAARANARFVLGSLSGLDGLLHRSWAKGETGPTGVLEDQAGYALGLLALHEATGETEWFEAAERLIRLIPEHFMDGDRLYATPTAATDLIVRPQDQMDNPQPSGASLTFEAVTRLALLTNDPHLSELADRVARGSGRLVEGAPSAVGHLLAALTEFSDPRELAVIGPDAAELAHVFWETRRPGTVLSWSTDPVSPVPLLAGRWEDGSTRAFLCRGFVCDRPVTTPEELRSLLSR